MRAGELRHLVTVQNPTRTQEATGGYSEAWVSATPAQVYAAIRPQGGASERVANGAERMLVTHDVTIRFHEEVNAKTRLAFGSRYLYVRGIANDGERNEFLTLTCEERHD